MPAAPAVCDRLVLNERILTERDRLLGADHPNTKVVRDNLAALTT